MDDKCLDVTAEYVDGCIISQIEYHLFLLTSSIST